MPKCLCPCDFALKCTTPDSSLDVNQTLPPGKREEKIVIVAGKFPATLAMDFTFWRVPGRPAFSWGDVDS